MTAYPVCFTKVKLPFGWLGNMSPYPIEFEGVVWRTAEALFQAMRFNDEEIKGLIRANKSPMGAKMAAKKHALAMTIQPQSDKDKLNMKTVLRCKLTQHPELKEQLIQTKDRQIIEDCTKRQRGSGLFWGAALIDGEWVGQNVLGELWMQLREELKGANNDD